MIKILFFIETLNGGGAEKVLRNLVNAMDQTRFDITVQTLYPDVASKELVQEIHYKYCYPLASKWNQTRMRIEAELGILYTLHIKGDYDLEIAYLECGSTKIISSSTNRKAVKLAWVHSDFEKQERLRESAAKLKKQYEKYEKIVCVSEGARRGFEGLFGKTFDTVVLPNVIDDKDILKKSREAIQYSMKRDKIHLIALGRLSQEKNYLYLIETCARLRDAGCSFVLNILGEGSEREKLAQKITSLNLQGVVFLRGFIENPYSWLRESDILVCSSKYEGLSTVIQEALILHKPVVTTPCSGMEELLGQSEYGMIVDDSKDGLYQGLYSMINSCELRNRYTDKARERAESLKKTATIQMIQDFFADLMQENAEGK